MNNEQRLFWAHGLRDFSHLTAAALVFGQAFSSRFVPALFALGLAVLIAAYTLGHYLLKPLKQGDL